MKRGTIALTDPNEVSEKEAAVNAATAGSKLIVRFNSSDSARKALQSFYRTCVLGQEVSIADNDLTRLMNALGNAVAWRDQANRTYAFTLTPRFDRSGFKFTYLPLIASVQSPA